MAITAIFKKCRNTCVYCIGAVVIVVVVAVVKYGLGKVEQQVRSHAIESLRAIVNSSHDTISRVWIGNLYYDAGEVLSNKQVVNWVKELLSVRNDKEKLKKSRAQKYLKQYFLDNSVHLNSDGFSIISPEYINLSTNNNERVGHHNVIKSYYPVKLVKVFMGIPQFVPPVHQDHSEKNDHHIGHGTSSTMFYMVPVRDDTNKIIAALAVSLNPYQNINSIAWSGRVGDTGETIVFDRDARLVTESRFQEELVSKGLLQKSESSIHNIALFDPVVQEQTKHNNILSNKSNKLTLMASRAIAHESGENLHGYRSYRDERVLGVWLWDAELSIGIATEISEHEALEAYRNTQSIVLTMFGIALLCTVAFLYFIRLIRNNSQAEIEKSEAYLRVVLENAADGIITMDEQGRIHTFNKAAEKLFQYSSNEIINKNVDVLVPESYKSNHLTYVNNYNQTGQSRLIDRKTNLSGKKKDGTVVPVSISVSMIQLPDKKIFVAIIRDQSVEIETQERLKRYQEELEVLVEEQTSALMESESLNRQILESAGEGIYGIDTGGKTIFVNPAAANMLGYEPDELIGEPMHDKIHHTRPDGSPYLREECPIYAAFTDGKRHDISDEVLWRKDGTSFPVEYTSKPIFTNDEITGAVVTFSDITARVADDAMLKDLNVTLENRVADRTAELHRYQSILDRAQNIAHLGSWNWDIVTGELLWSDEIFRIFGLEPQQFAATYEAFVEAIHPEDRDAVTSAVNASVTNKNIPYNIEHRIVLPSGDIRHVHEQGEIERDENGQPLHMIGIVHDITELKISRESARQVMQELARNERVLRLALLGAGAGYWHFNISENELYWDELSLQIFGINQSDFTGQYDDWATRVYGEDLESTSEAFGAALQDQDTDSLSMNYRIKTPTGVIRHLDVTGHIERDESRLATSVYGLHIDVTEAKRGERELIQAMESAELANRAKSEFLAVMSHEIRTPMNAIIGMSNLVMNTELTTRQRGYIKKVVSSAESLLHIINDILDFSKIEAGQLQMETIDFRLEEVLDKLTHLVVLKAQEKGLEFLFSIRPGLPDRLSGDPTRLLQILVNLASNAVKFTDEGEVVLSVELEETLPEQVKLKFTIRDTGVGIEPEKQQRLFKSFSQADASITRKYGGTGLGLVIVKRLVTLMGGDIAFESEPGKGTRFYFSIPFGYSDDVETPDHALPGDIADMRVLVVDDSESSRTILSETLEGFGFTVDMASNNNDAISAVQTAEQRGNPYRLVLMDWKMPEQSGVEGAKVILEQSGSSVTPVVMMVTAYNAEDLADEISDLAINSTLVKPVSPSSLLDAILNAFNSEQYKQNAKQNNLLKMASPAERLAGTKILVVEDNELNMELTIELLNDAGIQTASAVNGQEAIKSLDDDQFDCVLMDVHMPVMDGMEATRIIRKNDKYKKLPIIALTADALESDKKDFLSAGMNDVLVKPIQVDLMLQVLAEWVGPADSGDTDAISNTILQDMDMKLSIPGIDTKAGLETCNGKVSLYQKLLKKFIDEVEFIDHFSKAMKKGDHETAERLAHTLKGSAGNIGATGIQEAARELQEKFKEKASDKQINKVYKKLELEMMPVIHALGKLDLEPDVNHDKNMSAGDLSTLVPVMNELSKLLQDDDTDATEKIDVISMGLKNSIYEDDVNLISKHVNRYEFKEAMDCLNVLTEKIRAVR